jgi:pimeloyl-ACP methyl ester carboxylesterase
MREGRTTIGDLGVAYLEDGPADGPLALCLHGFPDSAWTWRHLLPSLADAGYHAVAPWLRGYAPTDLAPDGDYSTAALADDANRLHAALGGDERAILVGHDWGAIAAYPAAAAAPERWAKVVTVAVPPMAALAAGFLTYDQLRRSWYIFFFQNPLADIAVGFDDLRFVDRLWADWSPGYDAGDDLPRVKDALRAPEHLGAAIGYYRAMFEPSAAMAADGPMAQPWLYVHGRRDGCVGVELAGAEAVVLDDAGHFLHLERPDEFGRLVLDFLAR